MTKSLIFSKIEKRPEIALTMSIICCFDQICSHKHIQYIKKILRYMKRLKQSENNNGSKKKLFVRRYSSFN